MNRLIVWNDDWADEFDIFGYDIIEEEEVSKILEDLKILIEKYPNCTKEYYFGTNECMLYTYEDIYNIVNKSILITQEEVDFLHKAFGYGSKGQCFMYNILDEILDEIYEHRE